VFPGKGDHLPGYIPGDVIVNVVQKPHSRFARMGTDLFIKHKIGLAEALKGFKFDHVCLDNEKVHVFGLDVVKPGSVWKVSGLGMPKRSGEGMGDLYVQFEVEFPDALKGEALARLSDALKTPTVTQESSNEGLHACRLGEAESKAVLKRLQSHAQQAKAEGRQQHVQQCAQQ
jgi:DnaJ-class molecular chaperone